jgi:hypothetical protein
LFLSCYAEPAPSRSHRHLHRRLQQAHHFRECVQSGQLDLSAYRLECSPTTISKSPAAASAFSSMPTVSA